MHLNREREYARLSRAVEVEQEVASVSHYSSVFGPLYQLILVADLTGVIISVSQYLYVLLPHSAIQPHNTSFLWIRRPSAFILMK